VAEVLAAYETTCEAIPSFDVYVKESHQTLLAPKDMEKPPAEWEWVAPGPKEQAPTNLGLTRQCYSRGRYRMDSLEQRGEKIPEGALTTVWDGGREQFLNSSQSKGRIANTARTFPSPNGICYLNLFRLFDGDQTYAKFIRLRMPDLVTVERRDGRVILTAAPASEKLIRANIFGVRLHLAPEKGFMPVRIDILAPGKQGPRLDSSYYNELEEVERGQWMPTSCRMAIHIVDEGSKLIGREKSYYSVTVDKARSRFNMNLEDSLFTLTFPPGTEVNDQIRNVIYHVGAETKSDYLNFLASRGRLGMEELAKSQPPMLRAYESNRSRTFLVWFNVVVVACLLLAGVIRYWRQRRGATARG